jgi:hypothetical protein
MGTRKLPLRCNCQQKNNPITVIEKNPGPNIRRAARPTRGRDDGSHPKTDFGSCERREQETAEE